MVPNILHNGQDITRYVLEDDFPDYLEESFKGTGYFDVQLASVTFKILTSVTGISLIRKDRITFTEPGSGVIILNGYIDSIEDELSETPSITVFPLALLLKDTIVGELINTDDDEEEIYEYDTGMAINVRDNISAILKQVNSKENTSFKVTSTSCPDPVDMGEKKRFFGNILKSFEQGGFLFGIIQLIFSFLDGIDIRKKSDAYYIIQRDAGFFKKTWIEKGDWLNIKILGTKIKVPGSDIKLTTLGAEYKVYRCVNGGLEYVTTHDWAPLPPFAEAVPVSMKSLYGDKHTSNTTQNVTSGKVKSFLYETKYNSYPEIIAGFDLDGENSYFLATAKKKWNTSKHTLVLSFETPFDFKYWCTYRDAAAWEIIRELAIVTDRWLYVDENGLVYLLPRSSSIGDVTVPARNIEELNRKRHKEIEYDLNLTRYEENDGQVYSYGIRLRKNELEAIRKVYRERFQGERVEDTIKIIKSSQSIGLMKNIIIDGEDHGLIISKGRSLLESGIEVKAESYV